MALSLEDVKSNSTKNKALSSFKTLSDLEATPKVRPWEFQDEKRPSGRTYSAREAVKKAKAIVEKNDIQSLELTKDYLSHDEKTKSEELLKKRESLFDFQNNFVMEASRIKKQDGLRGWFKELFSH